MLHYALERKKAAALPPRSQSGSERGSQRASVSRDSWLMHETTLQHSHGADPWYAGSASPVDGSDACFPRTVRAVNPSTTFRPSDTRRETDCGTIDLSYLNNKYKKSDRTERRMATFKSREPWGQPTPKMPISSVLQNFLRYCRIQCCPSNYCCPPNRVSKQPTQRNGRRCLLGTCDTPFSCFGTPSAPNHRLAFRL